VKIAAYNIENLFDRAKAFNHDASESSDVVKKHARLNTLFERTNYTSGVKAEMLELMEELGILRTNQGPFVRLRKIRGQLISRPRSGEPYIKADKRDDWVGWCELRTASVNERAIQNTARVIRDLDADILALVEVESRPVLDEFNQSILVDVGGTPYSQLMVIDGNDPRGIDVGLMTKANYDIGEMKSHVHDLKPDGHPVFSRDCPEYEVTTPGNETIFILPNHFKSKFGGNDPSSKAKRLAQATATKAIYESLIARGFQYVVVLGDLNDTPDSEELAPLLNGSDLRDVSEHQDFTEYEFNANNGHRGIGTFGLGNDSNKIDFLLLSPALFDRVREGGIFRKGAWPGSAPPRWETYDELEKKIHVASDHHAIWVDLHD
jgi:endonuclease/exonuclease/phosphatase family metal-dependent hydrolase